MKTIALAVFIACVVGSSLAQDCSSKFQDFHKCLADSHKKEQDGGKAKFEAMKAKIDACYTDNGCTPPAKPQKGEGKGKGKGGSSAASGGASGGVSGERKGNNTEGRECRKALGEAKKKQFQDCVKQAVPSFTFPQKDGEHKEHHFGGEHKGGFNHKGENKQLDGCAKKEAVRDCKRALFNSSRPTEDAKKARFQSNCNSKQTCLTALAPTAKLNWKNSSKPLANADNSNTIKLNKSAPASRNAPMSKRSKANIPKENKASKPLAKTRTTASWDTTLSSKTIKDPKEDIIKFDLMSIENNFQMICSGLFLTT